MQDPSRDKRLAVPAWLTLAGGLLLSALVAWALRHDSTLAGTGSSSLAPWYSAGACLLLSLLAFRLQLTLQHSRRRNSLLANQLVNDAAQRQEAELRIAELSRLYTTLNAINRIIIGCRDEANLYQQVCDILIKQGGLQMAWIGLVERGTTKVRVAHAAGIGTDYLDGISISIDPEDPYGRGGTGTAIRENRPVWINNFNSDPITAPWKQRAAKHGWVLAAALPICRGGKPIGAVTFYSTHPTRYDKEIRSLLEEISRAISHTLDRFNSEELAQDSAGALERIFMQTVGLATNLVQLRDPYTAGHVQRVAELSTAIGRELGLDQRRVHWLRVASQLYDIGKILIPAEILSKPGKLSPMELKLIHQHPRAGFELLQNVDFPWPVAQAALQHQERLDGSGYPQGLKGDSIVLEARIIGVADVVLAMTSHRPWRAALPLEQAMADLEAGSGTRYDADVVAACLRLLREGRFHLQAPAVS
jgi:HD-GYP domain-containing protein (c-di-GMP phosphodiesterase class II)